MIADLVTFLVGTAVGFGFAYGIATLRQRAVDKLLAAIASLRPNQPAPSSSDLQIATNHICTTIIENVTVMRKSALDLDASLLLLRKEVRRTRKGVARVIERQFHPRTHRPETAEGRIDQAAKVVQRHWNQDTVDKGIAQLRQYYQNEDLAVPSDDKLREEAEQLLNASIQGETTID